MKFFYAAFAFAVGVSIAAAIPLKDTPPITYQAWGILRLCRFSAN
jgi:hypothetical protein